ncbi:uncharacterized protein EI90DRAFT_3021076 [Cantharellus anzutake]|uniref:uncharacterized protein n=1 Tax=Cantharellus anzutake TaxID=1750568 RepID=UPI001905FE1A|nr:uncharacterized protein EI90DRAFT_3021076 [Cantharellus anzutake]KAF8318292.1 hypothetical protein EI90DRAFT_3021076 [Cantharellus anzutake]
MPPKRKHIDTDVNPTSEAPINGSKRRRPPKGGPTHAATAPTETPSERATWRSHDEAELIHHLLEVKRAGGTSNIGFKDKVWNGASAHLLEQCGTVFKPSACKNKYGKLKQIYWAVKRLSEQSGFPWSNENGADLGLEEEQLWIDFVAVRVASGCSIPSKRVATL